MLYYYHKLSGGVKMFLYIKDWFTNKLFHILLIVFCSLTMFGAICSLLDLTKYRAELKQGNKDYYTTKEVDGNQIFDIGKPYTEVVYDIHSCSVGKLLVRHCQVKEFTVKYRVTFGSSDNVVDTFTVQYGNGYDKIQKSYSLDPDNNKRKFYLQAEVVDSSVEFSPQTYLPQIFLIVGCTLFIVPSAICLCKIRKEENG